MKNIIGTVLRIIAVLWGISGIAGITLSFFGAGSGGAFLKGLISLLLGWGLFRFGTWLKQKSQSHEVLAANLGDDRFKAPRQIREIEGAQYASPLQARGHENNAILDTDYQALIDENHVYRQIAMELETGDTDKGLWTRVFAECGGDEKQTKVLYIKQRADYLISAERSRLEQATRESAAEVAKIEEGRRQREAEIQRFREDPIKLQKIRYLADKHRKNPRMMIDEKEKLLSLAGGSFTWLDGYGRCFATFRGEEKQFPSGKEFSAWFITDIVPFLLSIEELE